MDHQLTERHARALLKITDNTQGKQLLEKTISHNLNVKQSEKLIEDTLTKTAEHEALHFQEDKGDHLEVRIIMPKSAS